MESIEMIDHMRTVLEGSPDKRTHTLVHVVCGLHVTGVEDTVHASYPRYYPDGPHKDTREGMLNTMKIEVCCKQVDGTIAFKG